MWILYSGLDRFVARKQLWADLESIGLTIKKEAHTQRVPRSQRGGEVIDPTLNQMNNLHNVCRSVIFLLKFLVYFPRFVLI